MSQRDARGSCGRVGVRGGGRRDSERVATRSREGRVRGGVILRRGVCVSVVERVRVCVRMECEADAEAEVEESADGEDARMGKDKAR